MCGGGIARLLGDLIAPPACAVCAVSCTPHMTLCPACERELSRGTGRTLSIPAIDHAWAARPHEGTAREMIHALKFRRLLPVARRAAELIAAESPPGVVDGRIVPVPADPLRGAWRGFDSANLIAEGLASETGLTLSTCLRRSRGPRQVGRSRSQRLSRPPRIRTSKAVPEAAVLVDDVATTGATLAAAAAALRRAGCTRLTAVVLAAAPA